MDVWFSVSQLYSAPFLNPTVVELSKTKNTFLLIRSASFHAGSLSLGALPADQDRREDFGDQRHFAWVLLMLALVLLMLAWVVLVVAWVADSFELASGPVGARSEPFGSSNLECTGSSCAHSFPGLSASPAGCFPRAKISDYFPLSQNLSQNLEW